MKTKSTLLTGMLLLGNIAFAQPANDLCADAIDISELFTGEIGVGAVLGPYSNVDATGEPELSSNLVDLWFDVAVGQTEPSIDQSVWFKFTGDGGVYQMATGNWCPGAAMYANDTQAALYSGTCDSLSLIVANDDIMYQWDSNLGWWYSIFNFEAMEGVDYWIMVDGYNHYQGNTFQGISAGSFCLHAVGVEPMTEHTICDGARNINEIFDATTVGSPGFVGPFDDSEVGSGIGMNPNADMLGTECWEDATDDGSVWFSFTGDGNSYTITHSQCGLDPDYNAYYFGYDSQMALYKGDCGELVPIDCSEDINPDAGFWWSQVGLDSEDGTEYFLRFDGFHWDIGLYDWSAEGSFCLRADLGNVNGLAEDEAAFITDVYPNPAQGAVTFSWSGSDNTADITVVDATGKTVISLPNVTRNQQQDLNLPVGHYIVQITTNDTSGTSRLQIVK
ncbi:MAG: T9SS type A sorting domain-containing protein [Flavobacteriales bacterium]|nr:T9SS type A sorting domain-containing protein [Flavobacteriales bacterium]